MGTRNKLPPLPPPSITQSHAGKRKLRPLNTLSIDLVPLCLGNSNTMLNRLTSK